jgi:hypothetical protein
MQSNWIKCSEQLPPPNKYVLIIINKDNWFDENDQEHIYYRVAKLVMEPVDIPPYLIHDKGNNKKPYFWKEFGNLCIFGQEVDYWMPLPSKPE